LCGVVTNDENDEENNEGLNTFKEALSNKMGLLLNQLHEMKKNC